MNRILLVLFVAWLLLANGLTTIKTWFGVLEAGDVATTIRAGAQILLTPQPTIRVITPPNAGTVSVRTVNTQPIVPTATALLLVTQTPSPLPTVQPAIPLDKGEYQFIDKGINVVNRYCVRVAALGKEICDPDVSMTWDETQQFVARSLKLGTMAGTPITQ